MKKTDADGHGPSHLFLIRLWTAEDGQGHPCWRGKVQHVITGEAHSFQGWDGLAELMSDMLPPGSEPSVPDD